jgi:hypothetical protein
MSRSNWHHLTARANFGLRPLESRELCIDLWRRLREGFPTAIAAVLMPTHLHLVDRVDPRRARWDLGVILRSVSRKFFPGKRLWEAIPEPGKVQDDPLHLLRQVRYVALNPCRDRLTPDPLQWEWSTYRELFGAVATPWVDGGRVLTLVLRKDRRLALLHEYVTAELGPGGTRLPGTTPASDFGLGSIERAAALALRVPRKSLLGRGPARTTALRFARAHSNASLAAIRGWFDISASALRAVSRGRLDREAERAMLAVLAEGRFLQSENYRQDSAMPNRRGSPERVR